tara:strand:- start:117766 stop:118335 length:570 start_codon:yes stop_codon:yes gene_type:complete
MSSSPKARRMARNHRRLQQQPRLNLVALMDIFTILVLFLMVNNGDVEVLQSDRDITLPESVSELRPEATVTVKVTASEILVDDRVAQSVAVALDAENPSLDGLSDALEQQAARSGPLDETARAAGRPIIIMGDVGMSYRLLKRIMMTCAAADYRDISLAVNSKPLAPDALPEAAPGNDPSLVVSAVSLP